MHKRLEHFRGQTSYLAEQTAAFYTDRHGRGPEPPASTELADGDQGVHSTGSKEAAGSLSHLGEKENHAVCQLESHVFTAVLDFCLTCFWESRWCI